MVVVPRVGIISTGIREISPDGLSYSGIFLNHYHGRGFTSSGFTVGYKVGFILLSIATQPLQNRTASINDWTFNPIENSLPPLPPTTEPLLARTWTCTLGFPTSTATEIITLRLRKQNEVHFPRSHRSLLPLFRLASSFCLLSSFFSCSPLALQIGEHAPKAGILVGHAQRYAAEIPAAQLDSTRTALAVAHPNGSVAITVCSPDWPSTRIWSALVWEEKEKEGQEGDWFRLRGYCLENTTSLRWGSFSATAPRTPAKEKK